MMSRCSRYASIEAQKVIWKSKIASIHVSPNAIMKWSKTESLSVALKRKENSDTQWSFSVIYFSGDMCKTKWSVS